MSRELLKRALHALEVHQIEAYIEGPYLIAEIRTELAKPEPEVIGWVEVINGVLTNRWSQIDLPIGKYRLLAERVDDE